jgi:hypothetical protein
MLPNIVFAEISSLPSEWSPTVSCGAADASHTNNNEFTPCHKGPSGQHTKLRGQGPKKRIEKPTRTIMFAFVLNSEHL